MRAWAKKLLGDGDESVCVTCISNGEDDDEEYNENKPTTNTKPEDFKLKETETTKMVIYCCHFSRNFFGWAKNFMINRLLELEPKIPLTFLYGEKTWLRQIPQETLETRPHTKVHVSFWKKYFEIFHG